MQYLSNQKMRFRIENYSQYRILNYALLITFISVLIYPLVITYSGYNIKSCDGHCPSCGITRDIYGTITFNHVDFINSKSLVILILMILLAVSRIVISYLIINRFRYVALGDIIFTSTIFIYLFFLFNKI